MKTILTTAAAFALAVAFSAPASAQQAHDQIAAKSGASGGQCAISKAMMAAVAENQQQHMAATKSRIDLLIENALASSRAAKLAGSPVKLGRDSPNS